MRHFSILFVSCAAIALSACSMLHKDAGTPAAHDTTPAAEAAAPVAPSTQEQKEISAMMGESAPAPVAQTTEAAVPQTPAPETAPDSVSAAATDTVTADTAQIVKPGPAPADAPKECPGVAVLPDTKSITYFDDPEGKPTGALVARASLVDIKGGCDYTPTGVIVDIDMIMKGRITDKGRYEGRRDLEAFMTFPYFVAVMDPSGKMIDKKILATAMRFKPQIDDLDHAEKITQTIPLPDIAQGPKYTITVGFQLNRAQLDYNRGATEDTPKPAGKAGTKKAPDTKGMSGAPKNVNVKQPGSMSDDPLAAAKAATKEKADSKPAVSSKPSTTGDTPQAPAENASTPAPAPAATQSGASKMSPIVE